MIKMNKKAEFVMKDYVMIGMIFMLIMASVIFLVNDMSQNQEVADYADVGDLEVFYDSKYVEDMNATTSTRLSELQDAGFFQTLFLTTLEIVQMIPRLVTMTVRSLTTMTGLLLGGSSEFIPQEISIILSIMIFMGLLWAVVYFIRRLSK